MDTRKTVASFAFGSLALSMLMASIPTATASTTVRRPINEVADAVDAATPEQLAMSDVPAAVGADGTFVANGGTAVDIPATAQGLVSATDAEGDTVAVGVGSASSQPGALALNGSVVYAQQGAVSQTVQPTEDGFRIHTVIFDSTAPTEYAHPVTIPAGARLAHLAELPSSVDDPGAPSGGTDDPVLILDSSNQLIGGFAAPWARDASGAAVGTHFEIRGGTLVQVVDHQVQGVTYPVVADPYLGFDLIKSYQWVYHTGYGSTLRVTPTTWARANAGGYLVGEWGFSELQKKTKGTINTNVDGMRKQYICHQQFVALWSPTKATWNLDQWRPNLSYAATVNARCNPGGGVIFD